QEPSSETRLISKRVTNQAETPSLENILTLSNQFEDIRRVTTNSKESSGVEADYPEYPTRVCKVEKAMYGLHQAPKAWYGTLSKYLLTNGFQRGTIDQTLFIRRQRGDFILVQVYVYDIIFGSSNPQLCREFEALMHEKFQMSAMGELNFFLGLQVLQKEDGIFLSQDKYVGDILKKFRYSDVRSSNTPIDKENPWGKDGTGKDVDLHLYRSMIRSLMYLTASRPDIMFAVCACARHQVTPKECYLHAVKRIFRYLKGHPKLGLWYRKDSPFDLVAYSDSDYGGASQDHKSTIGGCQFLGRRLISWQCKKQTIIATSTTEAEYVAAASCCGQVLWIQNQLLDYGYNFMNTNIYIDNTSAICIVKNLVYHSKTKHIEIRHHFIRDCFKKKLINVDHIHTDENVADLLTKPFDAGRFRYLVDSVVTMCKNFLHGLDSEQMTHEFIHIYLASASVYVWIGYALTFKPTIYVSYIRQFWSTARIETTEEGTQILATVDGVLKTVTESSLRRNLKLQDEEGISSLSDTELFENLTFMGYNISPNQKFTFQKDEPASPMRDVSQGKACPTDSGFIADQDRETIAKSSTLPHDSAPRVTSPTAEEGKLLAKFQAQEVEINRLKERVKILEDQGGVIGDRSRDDAPIKRRSMDEGEATTKRVSDNTEEMTNVLTTMDAATILASGTAEVSTGSGSIPTAGPSAAEVSTGSNVVLTASPVFATATVVTPYRRRKGKEVMVESETPKKQKLQEQIDAQIARELKEQLKREDQRRAEQIAKDAEIARIHAEEELQSMIDGLDSNNETVAKYLEEYRQFSSELPMERRIELISNLVKYQDNYTKVYKFQSRQRKSWTKKQKRDYYMAVIRNNLGWKVKDFKGMTFEEVEAKFNSVCKKMEDFIPMGSKEEAERIKRKGIHLEQESAKKQKSLEEITEEVNSASYQFFTDLLKHLDRDDLNQLWSLVKETLSKRPATSDNEMKLWVELSKLYEPMWKINYGLTLRILCMLQL
nr:putative ribonuclease H-like domain-containing protein [Tanacetum cinerariifolium]